VFMCLFFVFFHTISQKSNAARITKLRHINVPPWVLQTHLFWGQKIKGQGDKAQKTLPSWVTALLWMLTSSSFNTVYTFWLFNLVLRTHLAISILMPIFQTNLQGLAASFSVFFLKLFERKLQGLKAHVSMHLVSFLSPNQQHQSTGK